MVATVAPKRIGPSPLPASTAWGVPTGRSEVRRSRGEDDGAGTAEAGVVAVAAAAVALGAGFEWFDRGRQPACSRQATIDMTTSFLANDMRPHSYHARHERKR